ncbi:MAG: hypothetical protein ACK5MS_05150, partial [Planctomyces sp.]
NRISHTHLSRETCNGSHSRLLPTPEDQRLLSGRQALTNAVPELRRWSKRHSLPIRLLPAAP